MRARTGQKGSRICWGRSRRAGSLLARNETVGEAVGDGVADEDTRAASESCQERRNNIVRNYFTVLVVQSLVGILWLEEWQEGDDTYVSWIRTFFKNAERSGLA